MRGRKQFWLAPIYNCIAFVGRADFINERVCSCLPFLSIHCFKQKRHRYGLIALDSF